MYAVYHSSTCTRLQAQGRLHLERSCIHRHASLPPKTCAVLCPCYVRTCDLALRRNRLLFDGTRTPAIKLTQIMPEVGQLLYPNTRSRAKHIYTEEEVRVVS